MEHLLSNKVVAFIADTCVQVPVVGGVFRAPHAFSSNFDVSWLAEAAALMEVLVKITYWLNNTRACLGLPIIKFVVLAPSTNSLHQIVPEDTDTSLLCVRVDFVLSANHLDAIVSVGEDGESRTASAFVKLRIVGLVVRAALANILNDDQAWLALAGSVDEDLVGSTCIDSYAPLGNLFVIVPLRTLATNSTHAIEIRNAIAKESVKIEYFILFTTVALIIGAGRNLDCGLAVLAVFSVY